MTCSLCTLTKPLTEFNKRKASSSGYQARCRACQHTSARNHYDQNYEYYHVRNVEHKYAVRNKFLAWLETQSCIDCGEKDPVVLDCDHVGPKRNAIANLLRQNHSWASIERELLQCEVRCANCHRRVTAARHGEWRRALMANTDSNCDLKDQNLSF